MIFQAGQSDHQSSTTPLSSSPSLIPLRLKSIVPHLQQTLLPSLFIRAPWSFPSESASSSSLPANSSNAPSSSTRSGNNSHNGPLLDSPLSTLELQKILMRRIGNFNLPDDVHTQFADSITSFITTTTSLFAKLYILNISEVRKFLDDHQIITYIIMSQLQPFRVFQVPLMRLIRPLQWILAPFAAFTTPVTLKFTVQKSLEIFFPIFSRVHNQRKKKTVTSRGKTRPRASPPRTPAPPGLPNITRPRFVDDIVNAAYQFGERTAGNLAQAREKARKRISKSQSIHNISSSNQGLAQIITSTTTKESLNRASSADKINDSGEMENNGDESISPTQSKSGTQSPRAENIG